MVYARPDGVIGRYLTASARNRTANANDSQSTSPDENESHLQLTSGSVSDSGAVLGEGRVGLLYLTKLPPEIFEIRLGRLKTNLGLTLLNALKAVFSSAST